MPEPARRLSCVLTALVSSACMIAAPVAAQNYTSQSYASPVLASPAVDWRVHTDEPKYAAIVMDATTGQVLYQERADAERYPASLTKLMTLYLTFEALSTGRLKPTDLIVVSRHAAAQAPTKLGLRPGDTIDVDDAVRAMAVKSANDMAVAMAEKIGGSEERFAAMMTEKARELGMTHTRYVDANGLPDSRQVTSARDIAILCHALLRDYPQYYHYFGQEEFTYRGQRMFNHNHLLGRMPGVDGFKTGFTDAAGFNLAASAVRDGHRLIVVVLGGSSGRWRDANVRNLLLTGFDVEERHSRGEPLTVAENLFGAPPTAATNPRLYAQAGVSDPIDIVLRAAERGQPVSFPAAPVTQLAAIRPSLAAQAPRRGHFWEDRGETPSAQAPAVGARDWTVQVGEFRSGRLARRQIDFVADRFKSAFDDREGRVDHVGRRYRAIFSGFTEAQAHDACAALKDRRNVPCVAARR
ncbi:MAG: D-alanyl-D-alanine carboxypeptidase [Caulobacteraceae bacterium]